MNKKIVSTLFLLCALLSCSSEDAGTSETGGNTKGPRGMGRGSTRGDVAISVKAHLVARRPVSTFIVANTTLESVRDVIIYSKLNAIVSSLYVEEGSWVRKGQQVAQLDEREIRNNWDQAQIAVDQAKINMGQAEVKAKLSAANFDRARTLFEQKLTSQQEFDQAALANRTDELGLENAQQQLEGASARLEATQIQLEYTKILSPIQGTITDRLIDVGDRVNVNERLFSVQEFPPLWARIFVPEKALQELKVSQETDIRFEALPDQAFTGRIKMISPTVDAASGTVKVTIEVARTGNVLRPGMFGTVSIATRTHEDAITIPKKAILRERDLNFVFLIDQEGKVIKQEIQTGFAVEKWVEVLEGHSVGDSVVTVGYETLNDGYLVSVADWEDSVGPLPVFGPPSAPATAQASAEGGQPGLSAEGVPVQSLAQVQDASQPVQEAGSGDNAQETFTRPGAPTPGTAPQASAAGGDSAAPGKGAVRKGSGGPGGPGGQGLARMLENPEVRKAYEAKLKEDPSFETDLEKRRAFFAEMREKYGRGGSNQ